MIQKLCGARQETQREARQYSAVVHARASKNWNIAHSRPENFISISWIDAHCCKVATTFATFKVMHEHKIERVLYAIFGMD